MSAPRMRALRLALLVIAVLGLFQVPFFWVRSHLSPGAGASAVPGGALSVRSHRGALSLQWDWAAGPLTVIRETPADPDEATRIYLAPDGARRNEWRGAPAPLTSPTTLRARPRGFVAAALGFGASAYRSPGLWVISFHTPYWVLMTVCVVLAAVTSRGWVVRAARGAAPTRAPEAPSPAPAPQPRREPEITVYVRGNTLPAREEATIFDVSAR